MKQSDYIVDPRVWATRYDEGGFVSYTDFGRNRHGESVPCALAQQSIEQHKLGAAFYAPFDGEKTVTGEWGFAFLNLDGHYSAFDLQLRNAGWIKNKPKNDEEAVATMRNWLFGTFSVPPYNIAPGASGMGSINGHTLFEHYAASWGYDYVGAEIGENIACYQAHMAFTRGAARQYGCKPIMYFSNWNQCTIGTWETQNSWPENGLPTGGHSMSLLKRAYMMSYMGGAVSFTFEAGGRLAFYGTDRLTEDGLLELSPYGQAMQELVAFSKRNSDIGINYTPIGVALDYYHGLALCAVLEEGPGLRHDKAFGYFKNTAGDEMTRDFFKNLYAGAGFFTWEDYFSQAPEQMHQLNTPYGDTHDVITHTASQKVLNSYPVLVLMGDIAFTPEEVGRYEAYVEQGGTLVMNTAYLPYFESFRAEYKGAARQDIPSGEGTVIVYGPDYSVEALDAILKEQIKKHIPFTLSDEVEYLVNVKDGSLILTLINNEGVTKVYNEDPVTDESKAKTLTVTYTGDATIKQVKELYYGEAVNLSGNTVKTTVPAGDYRVFEFVFE
ncbi:MAG: hypothetical protein IJ518_06610 [Clostridia bacterium]|nr:hypothetical protein [Clostridia bacterium]